MSSRQPIRFFLKQRRDAVTPPSVMNPSIGEDRSRIGHHPAFATVLPLALTVRLVVATPLPGVRTAGLKVHEYPAGSPEQASATDSSSCGTGVTDTTKLAGVLAVIVPFWRVMFRLKSAIVTVVVLTDCAP
jgi:hypothetical protein